MSSRLGRRASHTGSLGNARSRAAGSGAARSARAAKAPALSLRRESSRRSPASARARSRSPRETRPSLSASRARNRLNSRGSGALPAISGVGSPSSLTASAVDRDTVRIANGPWQKSGRDLRAMDCPHDVARAAVCFNCRDGTGARRHLAAPGAAPAWASRRRPDPQGRGVGHRHHTPGAGARSSRGTGRRSARRLLPPGLAPVAYPTPATARSPQP